MTLLRLLLLAVLIAAGTMFLGWWTVPVIAAIYALLRRDLAAPRDAALAALLAWTALLARLAVAPAFMRLLERLGGIFPVPGIVVAIVSVLFATLLGWSAARFMVGLVANRRSVAARVNAESA